MIAAAGAIAQQDDREIAPGFAALGVTAFTTTRAAGSFGLQGAEPVGDVFARWGTLRFAHPTILSSRRAPHPFRSGTRLIFAPSAFSRSSMRS